jgi:uncharacterized protein (TIGR02118 family)
MALVISEGKRMYALIGILKKPDDMDTATFRKWWLEEHAMAARKLPKLRRYTVCPLVSGFDAGSGEPSGEPSHDGVAFLWFDTEADLKAAFASTAGKQDIEHGVTAPIKYLLFCTDGEIEIPLP